VSCGISTSLNPLNLTDPNRIMSVYGFSRTVVPHLLQANSRLTQWSPPQAIACGPHVRQIIHSYSLIMIISPQSGRPSAWSWFSIHVEKVGVAPSGLGARAVRNVLWNAMAFAEPLLSERPQKEPLLVEQLLPGKLLGWNSQKGLSENGFSRTVSLKQPGSENNFSENNFSPTARTTAKTNLESLLLERLLPHLGVLARAHHRKGSPPRLCGERVMLRVIDSPRLFGFGLPLNKSSAGRVHTQHHRTRLARKECRFTL